MEFLFIKSSNEVTDRFTWWFSGLLVELIVSNVNIGADVGWEHQHETKPPLSGPVCFPFVNGVNRILG
jgi:hypothetical protein